MNTFITIEESVIILRSPKQVWDFTQDFTKRTSWDRSITNANIIREGGEPIVEIHSKGGFSALLTYKLWERPRKTSLAMSEIRSPIIVSGGGSWLYEPFEGGTRWTQTNSLGLRNVWWVKPIVSILRSYFRSETKKAMNRAKQMIERVDLVDSVK